MLRDMSGVKREVGSQIAGLSRLNTSLVLESDENRAVAFKVSKEDGKMQISALNEVVQQKYTQKPKKVDEKELVQLVLLQEKTTERLKEVI